MGDFQYKTASGDAWTDVPKTAYHGTLEGTFTLEYPAPTDFDGNGRRCAAIGRPRIIMHSTIMTACGMAFWQGLISSSTNEDQQVWLTTKNPRTNAWSGWTGYLERPKYGRIQQGSGSGNTLFMDVEISVNSVCSVSWP